MNGHIKLINPRQLYEELTRVIWSCLKREQLKNVSVKKGGKQGAARAV